MIESVPKLEAPYETHHFHILLHCEKKILLKMYFFNLKRGHGIQIRLFLLHLQFA